MNKICLYNKSKNQLSSHLKNKHLSNSPNNLNNHNLHSNKVILNKLISKIYFWFNKKS